ncbi:MAG: FkbM family methyltransferase, partial [Planctomycetota bacterium]
MLLRIFGHKKHGTWIDVGANHPSHDSVTRNFYELGWRGINVEPIEEMHRLLAASRPEDVNLCCGVSERSGEMTFHRDESHLDWSTFDSNAARQYEAGGHMMREIRIPVTTLAEICRRHLLPGQDLDFLKLDVEGHELAVLAGHDFSSWRPTVIVAEVQPEKAVEMDKLLGGHGYIRRWFDGGNNWYVDSRQEHAISEAIWRPAYPVMDCYHPWVYAQSFPTTGPSASSTAPQESPSAAADGRTSPAAKSLLGTAVKRVRSAVRAIGFSAKHSPERSLHPRSASTDWLLSRCGHDPAAVVAEIHPDDDMYLYGRNHFQNDELAQLLYLRYGAWAMDDLSQIVKWRFGDFQKIGRMLDFACGYGRLTRFLVEAMPRERIWVSDVEEQAVAFERSRFGVNGFVSARNPADIHCDTQFDLICVVSLFSHLPRHTFGPMLERLLSMLAPGGILAFSVHDEIWCPPGTMPADGFAFVPHSESNNLSTVDYGTTFVTESFVRDCIAAGRGADWPYARLRRGLCSHQDVYLVSNDASVRYDGLPFRLGPEGCLDRCEATSAGGLELAGWAGDPDPGHSISEIQIRLNGRLVQSCQPVIPRPDVVAVLREPRYAAAGWQCLIDAESP